MGDMGIPIPSLIIKQRLCICYPIPKTIVICHKNRAVIEKKNEFGEIIIFLL